MNVTIKDIAKLAGVSINTVSRALNNKGDVNPKTKERIIRIAKEMDYTPNVLAQSLKSKRSHVIGVIVTNIANPFYGEILRVSEQIARRHDYFLMVFNTEEDKKKEREALNLLKARHIDGLLITPVTADEDTIQFLKDIGLPFVIMNRDPEISEQVDFVVNDNLKGSYLAVKHFYERGIRKIHYIAGPPNLHTVGQRILGCRQAIEEFSSQEEMELKIHNISLSMMDCYEKTKEIISTTRGERIGIFAYNDNLAIGAMKAIQESGLSIPQDIALIGHDDIRYASMLGVPLTTIRQSSTAIGEKSALILMDKINNPRKKSYQKVILEPELIIRKST